MIISSNRDSQNKQFEKILTASQLILEKKNKSSSDYFPKRTPIEFEVDVHSAMCEAAVGTPFEDTITLVSGHTFPDIISNNYYGVEVKTSRNNWKSTGNSVLESTRVENIERIYLFFGKMANPSEFRFRRYEECLGDVAVTHSPRYLIDMDLRSGNSIFDKMGSSYESLRKDEKPIKKFIDYYRQDAKPGEEPWWMDATGVEELVSKPTTFSWSALSKDEKDEVRIQGMALFPEIFGNDDRTKYQSLAIWAVTKKGIVDHALRDRFTAGGQETIEINGKKYEDIPKIFFHLKNNLAKVVECVKKLDPEEAKYFWNIEDDLGSYTLLPKWLDLVIDYAEQSLDGKEELITHLLGDYIGKGNSSNHLREKMKQYGLKYSQE